MQERPILFSGPMVRAILDGRKTQTRRVVTPQPLVEDGEEADLISDLRRSGGRPPDWLRCPYGVPGDRLWVRETFVEIAGRAHYREGGNLHFDGKPYAGKWRPSIHMPRWASRITLEVTGVRVERLRDITGNDILAEGVGHDLRDDERGAFEALALRDRWRSLWTAINGADSWDADPWVWVVEFKAVTPSASSRYLPERTLP